MRRKNKELNNENTDRHLLMFIICQAFIHICSFNLCSHWILWTRKLSLEKIINLFSATKLIRDGADFTLVYLTSDPDQMASDQIKTYDQIKFKIFEPTILLGITKGAKTTRN